VVSDTKRAKFLSALMNGASVKDACKQGGFSRTTAYDLRDSSAEFARAWDDAIEDSTDVLVSEARTRALDASDKAAHTLLMFLIRAARPEYRDNYKTETEITHKTVHEVDLGYSADEMLTVKKILKAAEGHDE
jgi:hypothetical protein